MKKSFFSLLLCLSCMMAFAQTDDQLPETEPVIVNRIHEWQDLKFGFMNTGVCTPSGKWWSRGPSATSLGSIEMVRIITNTRLIIKTLTKLLTLGISIRQSGLKPLRRLV